MTCNHIIHVAGTEESW